MQRGAPAAPPDTVDRQLLYCLGGNAAEFSAACPRECRKHGFCLHPRARGNAAQFFAGRFSGSGRELLGVSSSDSGEMLPNFSRGSRRSATRLHFTPSRTGKCCPFFSGTPGGGLTLRHPDRIRSTSRVCERVRECAALHCTAVHHITLRRSAPHYTAPRRAAFGAVPRWTIPPT